MLLGLNMGTIPTDEQIHAAACYYQTVIFGSFMVDAANKLRALDPNVKIFAYLDLSSARSYDGSNAISSGVSYTDAVKNGWVSKDNKGNQIVWPQYPGHYQMNVWDTKYQDAWVKKAVMQMSSGPWSGIFADNDLYSLKFLNIMMVPYRRELIILLKVTQKLSAGEDALVKKAGTAISSMGKMFVPNISDSRLRPDVYNSHSSYGGGFEEMFMSWNNSGSPTVYNWGDGGWISQIYNVSQSGRAIMETQAKQGDARTEVYAYASMLMRAKIGDSCAVNDGTTLPNLPPETKINIGSPVGNMIKTVNGVYVRNFEGGWAAVNPSNTETVIVIPPAGAKWASGSPVYSPVSLQPMSGVVFSR